MNSIKAKATKIKILINYNTLSDEIKIVVEDNGCGMDLETVKNVTNPFVTSRTTRKVGLGVSFLKGLTEMCNGSFKIESKLNFGTKVIATLEKDHIDLPPDGDFGEMMMLAIQANENIDYVFEYQYDKNGFIFDTITIKETLDGVLINEPSILLWIKDYINQEVEKIKEEQNEESRRFKENAR